ncbi:Long-chain-fatty-acid--CoA ligase [Roseivivax sp. THAF30]|nr:Long-chain-fatty-acid--CoA ligase [Roseivivax sp. THAF30]
MDERVTFDALLEARASNERMLVAPDGSILSVADFKTHAGKAAAWLRAQGIERGDRIALWLPNCADWLALLFGAARIGAMIVAINTRYRAAELDHVLGHSGARLLIFGGDEAHSDVHAILGEVNLAALGDLECLASFQAQEPIQGRNITTVDLASVEPVGPQDAQASDPVLLFTTSGTTSKPKLVQHSQGTLSKHARNCAATFGFDAPDATYLAALPFCGVFGLNPSLAAIAGGAPIHVLSVFRDTQAVDAAKKSKVTHFFGSDEMYRRMWELDASAFENARLCGFASFTPGLMGVLRDMAEAGLPLAGVYGASEVNAIFAIQPLDLPLEDRMMGGGRMAGRGDLRVRDPESGELLSQGEVGVLEIRAETNFTGYFRNVEATAKAIDEDGYFRSNDLGYEREEGTFVYLARNGEFIRLSGFLTDPAEIEEVIARAPGVAQAQVVGIEIQRKVLPVAFVIAEDDSRLDEDALRAFTEPLLAHYKIPHRFFFLDAFPTTASANGTKIQRGKLAEMARDLVSDGGAR